MENESQDRKEKEKEASKGNAGRAKDGDTHSELAQKDNERKATTRTNRIKQVERRVMDRQKERGSKDSAGRAKDGDTRSGTAQVKDKEESATCQHRRGRPGKKEQQEHQSWQESNGEDSL